MLCAFEVVVEERRRRMKRRERVEAFGGDMVEQRWRLVKEKSHRCLSREGDGWSTRWRGSPLPTESDWEGTYI